MDKEDVSRCSQKMYLFDDYDKAKTIGGILLWYVGEYPTDVREILNNSLYKMSKADRHCYRAGLTVLDVPWKYVICVTGTCPRNCGFCQRVLDTKFKEKTVNCGAFAKKVKRCSRCLSVAYCGVRCQKQHWRATHRFLCGFEIA